MRQHVILRDDSTGVALQPEAVLRSGVSLVSRQSIPPYRFGIVLRDAIAVVAPDPEVELRVGVSRFSTRTLRIDVRRLRPQRLTLRIIDYVSLYLIDTAGVAGHVLGVKSSALDGSNLETIRLVYSEIH